MQFRFPILIGLMLLILPSTWAGAAVWGQIDNISLFFILLSTIFVFKSWLAININKKNQKIWQSGIWLILASLSICLCILTKQLNIFSLPFLMILFCVTAWKFWENFNFRGIFLLAFSLMILAISFRYIDTLLEIPAQYYHSSYWFVWKEGSQQGDQISGNGFNLWVFLARNMRSSSHISLFNFKIGSWQHGISPYQAGIFLYSTFLSFLIFGAFKGISQVLKRRIYVEEKDKAGNFLMALLCLFHGLSHLLFNIFLSGTHERYLYVGYPFILIAAIWFYINKIAVSWRLILFLFFTASAYGYFVFSIIKRIPILFPLQSQQFLASIHLFLLVLILDVWIQVCWVDRNNLIVKICEEKKLGSYRIEMKK
jgi:hypothetical protein